MSRTIDEKVVEMRFDNKQFENGARESISTLDKLKQALNLSDSTKGLEGIQKAAQGVNLSGIGTAIDGVKQKFSALETIAVGALMRIGQKAVDAGERLIRSLTVEPISQGFGEYELKMGSVQTIMASTGESLSTVNGYLDELNTYADQTIYSFSDMTSSIGKFTNAGVSLDDAVKAIQGISNEAAVSGANANEASRAMYNFAQALSAGAVKLIDWKSIENANMATVEFKQSLLDTALAMGTVVKVGDQYQSTTVDMQGKVSGVFDATSMFNDSLSAQWMTTDVLVQTLGNYSTDIRKMTDAEKEAYEEKLRGIGYTEEQIKKIEELGKKAFNSAQDVKTFSQLMDTLKEAVGSGWAQTFELIFGDLEEAKELWTEVSQSVGGFIDRVSSARNALIGGALDKLNLTEYISDLTGMTKESAEELSRLGKETGYASEEFQELASALAEGDENTQRLITGLMEMDSSGKDVITYISDLTGMTKESVSELAKLGKETGYTSEEFQNLANKIADGDEKMTAFITSMLQADISNGRDNLIDSIRNSLNGLLGVIKPITDAFREIFPPVTSDQLYNLTVKIREFTEGLKISDETADKIKRTFKGVFAVFDILKQGIGAVIDLILPGTTYIGSFADKILDVTANIGDWIVALDESIRENDIFTKAVDKIRGVIDTVVGKVKNFIKVLQEFTEPIWKAVKPIQDFIKTIQDFVSTKFKAPDLSFITDIADTAESRFHPLQTIFDFFGKVIQTVVDILVKASPIIGTVASTIGKVLSSLGKAIADAFTGGGFNAVLDLFNGGVLAAVGLNVSKFLKGITTLTEGLGDEIKKRPWDAIVEGFTTIKNSVLDTFGTIQEKLRSDVLKNIAIAIAILAGSLLVLSLINSDKLTASLKAITVLFLDLFGSMAVFEKIMDSSGMKSIKNISKSMIVLAAGVLILAMAMKVISNIDSDKLFGSLLAVSLLLGEMSTVAIVLSKYGGKVKTGAISIIAFAGAIYILSASVKKLGELNTETLIKGLTSVGVLLAELAAFLVAAKFGKLKLTQAAGIAVLAGALIILQGAVSDFGKMDTTQILKGITATGAILAELAVFSRVTGKADHILATSIAMIALAAAMNLLEGPMTSFGNMSLEQISKGLLAMGGALVEVAIAMKLMPNNSLSVGIGLIEAAAGITIIGIALKSMSEMTWEEMAKGLVTLGVALAEMAIAMNAMKGTLSGSAAMLVMSAALLAFTPVLKSLGGMEWNEIAKGIIALAGAFAVIGVAGAVLSPIIPSILGLAGAMALLGVAIAGIGVGLLAGATGLMALAAAGTAAAATIVAMLEIITVGLINIVADSAEAFGNVIKTIILTICEVVVQCVPQIVDTILVVVKEVLASLAENVPDIVHSLLQLIIGIIDALAADLPTVIQSVVNLFMAFFAGIVDALQGIDVSVLIEGIVGIGLLSALMLALAAMASLAPSAMVGVLAMGATIAELAIVLAAIGALSQIPGLQWLIGEGGNLLQGIGTAIGQFIGGIVGGFMSGVSAQFPQIGADLSAFMLNLTPFLVGAKMITPEILDSVKSLAEVILLLTAADILQGLTSWLTGGTSLASFGEELAAFGPPFAQFANDVQNVNPEVIEASANAAKALAEMASTLPNSGGLAGKIFGENNLSDFGKELELFGPHIAKYAEQVKNVKPEAVEASVKAAQMLADMASTLPNSGGLAGKIFGDNKLSDFGKELELFSPHIAKYSEQVQNVKPEAVDASAKAAQMLADMASTLPNSGGLSALIFGDNKLSDFGKELAAFGPYIAEYAKSVENVNPLVVTVSSYAAKALAELANNLPNSGGLLSWFKGDNDIGKFGKSLAKFGEALKKYYESISGIKPTVLSRVISEVSELIDLAEKTANLDTNGLKNFSTTFKELGKIGIDDFVKTFNDSSTNVKEAIDTFIGYAVSALNNSKSKITEAVKLIGNNVSTNFVKGFTDKKASTVTTIKNIGTSIINALKEGLASSKFVAIAHDSIQSFITGINDKTPTAKSSVSQLCQAIITQMNNSLPSSTFEAIGSNIVTDLASGIRNNDSAVKAATDLANNVTSSLQNKATNKKAQSVGQNVSEGLSKGIESKSGSKKVVNAAKKLGEKAIDGTSDRLLVKSPSRVFMNIGKFVALGMAGGILNYVSSVSSASLDLANSAVNPVEMAISSISDMVENDIDCNPILTPVIDLSKARQGVEQIGSMYQNLDVSSAYNNALSVASGMTKSSADNIQNGSDSMAKGLQKMMDKFVAKPSQKFDNNFYITGDNPKEIANEVSRIIQQQVERREAIWG